MNLPTYAYQIAVAVASLSFSVNAYFIKSRVDEIAVTLKDIAKAQVDMQINQAVMHDEVERDSNRLETHHNRLQTLEAAVNKMLGAKRSN